MENRQPLYVEPFNQMLCCEVCYFRLHEDAGCIDLEESVDKCLTDLSRGALEAITT